jgi:phospholipase C
MKITRREFLTGASALGATVALGGARSMAQAASPKTSGSSTLPDPAKSGIEHIVVLCMENRSFDHYLGWVRGAEGRQAGLSYPDESGLLHDTHHLQDWSGCGFNDPNHGYNGGHAQLNGGAMDGFRKGGNDDFALGYYESADLPTTTQLVNNFTISDTYFCSILGPTYPNRFYTHAATTDRISNTSDTSTLPTIWDRLADKGISANYYFSDLPFLLLWGDKYLPIARPVDTFFAQAATGTLPAYTYLDPFFLGEDQGGSNDDHPHADIRRGQSFVAKVVNALMSSPTWSSTVLVITYDEWGGFFEHVVPPVLPDNPPLFVASDNKSYDLTQAGFRVPLFVVSPFASTTRRF